MQKVGVGNGRSAGASVDNRWQLSGSTLDSVSEVEFWDRTPLERTAGRFLVVISKPVRRWECSMSMMFPITPAIRKGR